MDILRLPDGSVVVVRLREIYPAHEHACGLAYRRLLGVIRLSRVIADQLGVGEEAAAALAAALVGVGQPGRHVAWYTVGGP